MGNFDKKLGWLSWCIKDLWGTKVMFCYVVKWPGFPLQRGSAKSPIAPSNFSPLWLSKLIQQWIQIFFYKNYMIFFSKSFAVVEGAFLSPFYVQFQEIFLKLWTIFYLNLKIILQDRRCKKIWKCPQTILDLILSHI